MRAVHFDLHLQVPADHLMTFLARGRGRDRPRFQVLPDLPEKEDQC